MMFRNKDYIAFCHVGLGGMFEYLGKYNIFMQCDNPNDSAFRELPDGYSFRLCRRNELEAWKRVLVHEQYVDYVTAYYDRVYAPLEDEFFRRCLFVCDNNDTPIASTFIWQSYGLINTIGWFGVVPEHEGKGLGRALISEILRTAAFPVYLHTQPTSARAIKLYSDFGFKLITSPMPGSRKNDLEDSLPYMRKVLPGNDYANLQFTTANSELIAAIQSSEMAEF
jgi:GNAT superfamily N-acetyltransferase